MVETIGVSQFACQQFTEAGVLGELITTPLSENSIGGASGQERLFAAPYFGRTWHLANIRVETLQCPLMTQSGHGLEVPRCPLMTQRGHQPKHIPTPSSVLV